jgi:astacin
MKFATASLIVLASANKVFETPANVPTGTVNIGADAVPYYLAGKYAIGYGDIVIGTIKTPNGDTPASPGSQQIELEGPFKKMNEKSKRNRILQKRSAYVGGVWPGAVMKYRYGDVQRDFIPNIQESMRLWTEGAARQGVQISFREANSNERDVVLFQSSQPGCWATLGYTGGDQRINLDPSCGSIAVIAHEIGHAFGLIHEQARNDRDQYVNVYYENIMEEAHSQYNKQDSTFGSAYDISSVMHYFSGAFQKPGASFTTMTTKDGQLILGQSAPSESDYAGIAHMYGGGSKPSFNWATEGITTYTQNCDWVGNDLTAQASATHQCGGICEANSQCTHFTWADHNGGTCYLKQGRVQVRNAISKASGSTTCGLIDRDIVQWIVDGKATYANNCDFAGNDIRYQSSAPNQCGGICEADSQCTHFTWANHNGGTCYLKGGPVHVSDAVNVNFSTSCGVIAK